MLRDVWVDEKPTGPSSLKVYMLLVRPSPLVEKAKATHIQALCLSLSTSATPYLQSQSHRPLFVSAPDAVASPKPATSIHPPHTVIKTPAALALPHPESIQALSVHAVERRSATKKLDPWGGER